MDKEQVTGTAVIIGGSIAGLLTAHVLAEHYARVTIVERDSLPEKSGNRKGVPQGRHAHALLSRGREVMEQFFPGLTEALIEQGAGYGHSRYFSGGGYLARHPETPASLYVSRPCLEAEVRRRVRALANVRIIEQCDVLGLVSNRDNDRIIGVELIRRRGGSAAEVLPADLVVDAGGRGTRTPAWLEALGYAKPEVELVEVKMGYASRLYERKPDHLEGNLMINIAPTPDNRRACAVLAQEGDCWIVTLAGYFGDYPPVDDAGFLAFARKLPASDVFELISRATPLGNPIPYKFPSNQRWRYENLTDFPDGLLVIGDAICSFTPIYGQGISVAALEALVLEDCLSRGKQDLARRFFQQVSKVVDIPWSITVGNDRHLSGAKLPAPRRFINWYLARLQVAARHDPVVALAFRQVGNLSAVPTSLLHPLIVVRVFKERLLAPVQNRDAHSAGGGQPDGEDLGGFMGFVVRGLRRC